MMMSEADAISSLSLVDLYLVNFGQLWPTT